MPASKDRDDTVEQEDAAELPKRDAMSVLVDPGALLGGTALPTSPTSTAPTTTPSPPTPGTAVPTPGTDVPTPGGEVPSLPHLPLPESNPGGTYQPDTSATSKT